MRLRRGVIIDAKLDPTLGSETGKMRPCIIVTNDLYNALVPVIQVVPITAWSEKKARIVTNIEITATENIGLTKTSIVDSLQTCPIDYKQRMTKVRGTLDPQILMQISEALKIVFNLSS